MGVEAYKRLSNIKPNLILLKKRKPRKTGFLFEWELKGRPGGKDGELPSYCFLTSAKDHDLQTEHCRTHIDTWDFNPPKARKL